MQKFHGPQKNNKTIINEPSTSVIDIMKNFKESKNANPIVFEEAMTSTCNGEDLNLTCTNSVFGKKIISN